MKTKAEKKMLLACVVIDNSINKLNENGFFDHAKAKRKATSFRFWAEKSKA